MKIIKNICLIIITLIFCVLYYNTSVLNNRTKKPSIEYLRQITVLVAGKTPDKSWVGTGVVIKITEDYTYVLTNRHVAPMEDSDYIYVYNEGCGYKKATVLKNTEWDKEDMSLIRIYGKLKNKRAVKGIRNPKTTDTVFMMGNHGGKYQVYREGIISKLNVAHMYVQLPAMGGDSGTGLIDKEGYLVGLVFALELDRGYLFQMPIVLVPNHTITVAMKGVQIQIFLDGEL